MNEIARGGIFAAAGGTKPEAVQQQPEMRQARSRESGAGALVPLAFEALQTGAGSPAARPAATEPRKSAATIACAAASETRARRRR